MRSAGFVYLGLAKLLLPTTQALSKPMLSFPQPEQAKKILTKWKKNHEGHTCPESLTALCTDRNASTWKPTWVWPRRPAPIHSLPVVAAVSKQKCPCSSQESGATGSGLELLFHRTGKEPRQEMGRKPLPFLLQQHSERGGSRYSFLKAILPIGTPYPQIHLSLDWLSRTSTGR